MCCCTSPKNSSNPYFSIKASRISVVESRIPSTFGFFAFVDSVVILHFHSSVAFTRPADISFSTNPAQLCSPSMTPPWSSLRGLHASVIASWKIIQYKYSSFHRTIPFNSPSLSLASRQLLNSSMILELTAFSVSSPLYGCGRCVVLPRYEISLPRRNSSLTLLTVRFSLCAFFCAEIRISSSSNIEKLQRNSSSDFCMSDGSISEDR